jgi:hypothetical protein
MNSPTLRKVALALIARRVEAGGSGGSEADLLAVLREEVLDDVESVPELMRRACQHPQPADRRLLELATALGLSLPETLACALAAAVEEDTLTGRLIAFAQAPVGGSRPTLGLLATAFAPVLPLALITPATLAAGPAVQSGLLLLGNDPAPYPERTVALPAPLSLALAGRPSPWPGAVLGNPGPPVPLPTGTLELCRRHADSLQPDQPVILVLRSASLEEARSAAQQVANHLGGEPCFLEANAPVEGLVGWLRLNHLIPVFLLDPAPGEVRRIPSIPLYRGPILVIAGTDGALESTGRDLIHWTLPLPTSEERESLWQEALGNPALAAELAPKQRLGAGRIAQLGRLTRHYSRLAGDAAPDAARVAQVARSGEGSGLESLAQSLPEAVPDKALVRSPELAAELQALLNRCRFRDGLAKDLGLSASTRYSAGVRALFTGPSGTGKTLAAGWLATQLELPLYRVDLASVTSKYIGETEKNLERLLSRAEGTAAVLLFDEADSLFGKRTEVRESNDRFANAQTNYLLQRMETFTGIALLTSNSRGRFDSAFSRRLDLVIEFPPPGPLERRALWVSHLNPKHNLTPQQLNLLAGQCDFAGGQIRNVVLSAAVAAQAAHQAIDMDLLLRALAAEYRKSGRSLPSGLQAGPTGTPP